MTRKLLTAAAIALASTGAWAGEFFTAGDKAVVGVSAPAFRSAGDAERFAELVHSKDTVASVKFMVVYMAMMLTEGTIVTVEQKTDLNLCIRKVGDYNCHWTRESFLRKPTPEEAAR